MFVSAGASIKPEIIWAVAHHPEPLYELDPWVNPVRIFLFLEL